MPPPDALGNKRLRMMTTRSNSKSTLVPPDELFTGATAKAANDMNTSPFTS